MIRFLSVRLGLAAITLLVALALVFITVRLLPNNPVLARMGQHAVSADVAKEMARQGWDRPVVEQLGSFLGNLARGDLGESFFNPSERVAEELMFRRVPATIELSLAAFLIALPLGIAAGIAAAVWRNGIPDYLCMSVSLLGVSIPVFFLGICLIGFFTALPTGGRQPFGMGFEAKSGFLIAESLLRGRFDVFLVSLKHLLLPALALSTIPLSIIARVTRSSMLEVLSSDYVRTARAKGANWLQVVLRHALPNASIPIVNVAGFQIGSLLTGAVLTETVFTWPGLGSYLFTAVQNTDYAVVQGGALVLVTIFLAANLIVDVSYVWLDPRIRLE